LKLRADRPQPRQSRRRRTRSATSAIRRFRTSRVVQTSPAIAPCPDIPVRLQSVSLWPLRPTLPTDSAI